MTATITTDTLVDQARAILSIHRADAEGFCLGCLELTAKLAWAPCPQARWAHAVVQQRDAGSDSS